MCMAGIYAREEYSRMIADVKKSDFSRMDVVHHILSGFKSVFTA